MKKKKKQHRHLFISKLLPEIVFHVKQLEHISEMNINYACLTYVVFLIKPSFDSKDSKSKHVFVFAVKPESY